MYISFNIVITVNTLAGPIEAFWYRTSLQELIRSTRNGGAGPRMKYRNNERRGRDGPCAMHLMALYLHTSVGIFRNLLSVSHEKQLIRNRESFIHA